MDPGCSCDGNGDGVCEVLGGEGACGKGGCRGRCCECELGLARVPSGRVIRDCSPDGNVAEEAASF
jgi:hypothetical protein